MGTRADEAEVEPVTLVLHREGEHDVAVTASDASVRTCATCGHPAVTRSPLARVERAALRLVGNANGRRCGAEANDVHAATSWGEPPCACTDAVHR